MTRTIGNNNMIARLKRQRVIKEVRVEGSKEPLIDNTRSKNGDPKKQNEEPNLNTKMKKYDE